MTHGHIPSDAPRDPIVIIIFNVVIILLIIIIIIVIVIAHHKSLSSQTATSNICSHQGRQPGSDNFHTFTLGQKKVNIKCNKYQSIIMPPDVLKEGYFLACKHLNPDTLTLGV